MNAVTSSRSLVHTGKARGQEVIVLVCRTVNSRPSAIILTTRNRRNSNAVICEVGGSAAVETSVDHSVFFLFSAPG